MRPYTGVKDGAAKKRRPGTERLAYLICRRHKFLNAGTWVVRDMRGKPGQLSVHATGRAMDVNYGNDRAGGVYLASWLVRHADALGIEAIHDYRAVRPRAWRCDRAAWKYTDDLGPGGSWLHIEISPTSADDGARIERIFRSLSK